MFDKGDDDDFDYEDFVDDDDNDVAETRYLPSAKMEKGSQMHRFGDDEYVDFYHHNDEYDDDHHHHHHHHYNHLRCEQRGEVYFWCNRKIDGGWGYCSPDTVYKEGMMMIMMAMIIVFLMVMMMMTAGMTTNIYNVWLG